MKGVLIHRQLSIGKIDLGVGLQQPDRPLQTFLDHRAAHCVGGVTLPGEKYVVVVHGGDWGS